jgi:hypothetical protein
MKVDVNLAALKRTRWYEYAVRFVFGGTMTVTAGLIAERFGSVLGGLFLAFPAIFPASATLIDKHEAEKKSQAGISQTDRGRQAAALDANGAAIGAYFNPSWCGPCRMENPARTNSWLGRGASAPRSSPNAKPFPQPSAS